jgi:hypothetical protein
VKRIIPHWIPIQSNNTHHFAVKNFSQILKNTSLVSYQQGIADNEYR